MEHDATRRSGREHAVDDHAMEVQVGIEGGTEAVDDGDCAEAGRGARTRAVRAQALLHRAQEQAQGRALKFGITCYLLLQRTVPEALKKANPGTKEFRLALRDALEGVKEMPATHGVYTMTAQATTVARARWSGSTSASGCW